MSTGYRAYFPDQGLLLPSLLSDWLPGDHLAYFISDTVDAMDLEAFHARYEGDGRRRQPFDPRMMVKVLIYGYASGVLSSRKIARKLHEDVAFRLLCANNYPAHRTIREFRQLHLQEFSADRSDIFEVTVPNSDRALWHCRLVASKHVTIGKLAAGRDSDDSSETGDNGLRQRGLYRVASRDTLELVLRLNTLRAANKFSRGSGR